MGGRRRFDASEDFPHFDMVVWLKKKNEREKERQEIDENEKATEGGEAVRKHRLCCLRGLFTYLQ